MSSPTLSRKQFIVFSAASAAVAAFLQACDSGDTTTSTSTGGTPAGGGTGGGAHTGGGGAGGTAAGGTSAGSGGAAAAGSGGAAAGSGGAAAGSGGAAAGSGGAAAGSGGAAAGSGGAAAGSGGAAAGSGGASAGAGGGGGGSCSADIMVTSSGTHMHTLLVTAAQIASGVDVTIQTSTTLSHSHWVKVTAADFTMLKAGMTVTKKSCSGTNPNHEYVLKCGGAATMGVIPDATECPAVCGDMMTDPCS